MLRFIFLLIFRIKGWKVVNTHPEASRRCVIVAAPHTSNWDFVYAIAAFVDLKIPYRFTIKKEWLRPPFGWFIKPLGAIGINRKAKLKGEKKRSTVDAMIDLFEQEKELAMVVTIEGTRKKVDKIKTGFYHVALNAGVPIGLGYMDYEKKVGGIGGMIYPTGNYEEDLKKIYAFFAGITPCHPALNSFVK